MSSFPLLMFVARVSVVNGMFPESCSSMSTMGRCLGSEHFKDGQGQQMKLLHDMINIPVVRIEDEDTSSATSSGAPTSDKSKIYELHKSIKPVFIHMTAAANAFFLLVLKIYECSLQSDRCDIKGLFQKWRTEAGNSVEAYENSQKQYFIDPGFDKYHTGVRSCGIRHSGKFQGLLENFKRELAVMESYSHSAVGNNQGEMSQLQITQQVFGELLASVWGHLKKMGDRITLMQQELSWHAHIRGIPIVEGLQTPVFVFHDLLGPSHFDSVRWLIEKIHKHGVRRPTMLEVGVGDGSLAFNILDIDFLDYIGVDSYYSSAFSDEQNAQLEMLHSQVEQQFRLIAEDRKSKQMSHPQFYRTLHSDLANQLPDNSLDIVFINDLTANPANLEGLSSSGRMNANPNQVKDPSHPNAGVEIRGDEVSDRIVQAFGIWSKKIKYGGIVAGSGIMARQVVEAVCDFRTANEVHLAGGGVFWWYVEPPDE